MITNLVNTDLSEELLDSLTREERTEVLDYIQNVPFINNLVSIDRPYAKDIQKDDDGKIIVDIAHPHILENMDFFRKPALNYMRHGSFTNLRPNGNPNSPFMKWLRNEVYKCWYGVMRPSDGEWIPGYYYYYLNYSPIERSTDAVEGSNMVMRTTSFPDVYDGDYLFFHYIDQARRGGKYNNFMGGQHASIIAARGKGKAISDSTIVLTTEGYKLWCNIKSGDYLYGDDGYPTKVTEVFEQGVIPIYEITFSDNRKAYVSKDHLWTINRNNKNIVVDTNWLIEHNSKHNRLYNNHPIEFDYKYPTDSNISIINDIYKNKYIDTKYLYSSIKIRSYILFNFIYPTKESEIFESERLAKDLAWIARSLGYTAILSTVGLFKKKFKLKIDFEKSYVTIKSIKYSHNESARCVVVDNDSHLFLMNDFIVTHNSFKCASMSSRNLILGENKDICEKVKTAIVASSTEYLTKDGTINKVLSMVNFLSKNTQFPSSRIKSSMQDMNWVMGYKNPKNKDIVEGTQNELIGIAFNNPNKGRGKRSQLMIWEEFGMFPNFLEAWNTSRPNVEEGKFAFGQMISIGCVCAGSKVWDKNGNLFNIEDLPKENGILGYDDNSKQVSKENITYCQEPFEKECIDIELFSGRHIRCSLDHPILCKEGIFKEAKDISVEDKVVLPREVNIFSNKILDRAFELGLSNKIPNDIHSYSRDSIIEYVKGLFLSRGYTFKDIIELRFNNHYNINIIQLLLQKLGIHSIVRDNNLIIYGDVSTRLFKKHINDVNIESNIKENANYIYDKVVSIHNIGKQIIYNLTANSTHTYLVNGIVTHNTGGTEGSDFSGALEMIYNPAGYNVYGVPNLFDKGSNGSSKSVFFWGEYLNRKGCYDKNGNTDVVKALIEIIKDRLYIKYNSTDINAITQNIAERPITIQEAIMKRDGTLFPVADLTAHLHYIDTHIGNWYDDTLVGELIQDPDGSIKFKPTTDEPIRTFPLKDNKHKGALEIYKLPISVDNKVQPYRYIGGIDPVDDDSSTTVSLPSIQIMDLFTDEIVAEYTGRPDYANDFYEVCRKLALFYNASLNYENDKKGLFSYFSNNHCTYLLCDTPEILRDVELVKSSLYGNKSKGVNSGKQVNAYARRLIRDWLLSPKKSITIEQVDGVDVEKEITTKKLSTIKSRALVQELINWTPDINCDRVSSLGMLMILRESCMKYLPGEGTTIGKKKKGYLGNDPFFNKNYSTHRI